MKTKINKQVKNNSCICAPRHFRKRRGFSLIEVLIAFSIFSLIMGLVLTVMMVVFRSLRQGEKTLNREQRQRVCLSRLSKEVSSLTRISSGAASLVGTEESFFLSRPEKIAW